MRLDKYLKISRIIKRRTVANEACDNGRVTLNGRVARASAEVKPGDIIVIAFGNRQTKVEVLAVNGADFLRYDGIAKVVKNEEVLNKIREMAPQIMEKYDQNGWEMGVFYLENGHAEFRKMMTLIEEFDV